MTPAKILDSQRFKWIPSSQTDIIKTWERFGYVKPSESAWFLEKWNFYKRNTYGN
jgi:hypothetical protein